MLLKEEKWYKSQSVEPPSIPFLDNSCVVGMFHSFNFGSKILKNIELIKFLKPISITI